jgi:hypothetical protein
VSINRGLGAIRGIPVRNEQRLTRALGRNHHMSTEGNQLEKPLVNLVTGWCAERPSLNYMFHLLFHHINSLNPQRSLDAGAGELRNYWMFPNHYVGIGHERAEFFKGMKRPPTPELMLVKPRPEVYLMRLESDFSFLGEFDLCVCTRTIFYVDDRFDVIQRLSARVKDGGALIFDDYIEHVDRYLALLKDQYEDVSVVYWGLEGCNELCPNMPTWSHEKPPEAFTKLTHKEMFAPNRREGHSRFYLFAQNKKKVAQAPVGPRPEIIKDDGLLIVKADIPRLEMQG